MNSGICEDFVIELCFYKNLRNTIPTIAKTFFSLKYKFTDFLHLHVFYLNIRKKIFFTKLKHNFQIGDRS